LLVMGVIALNLFACTIVQPVVVSAPTDKQLQKVLTPPEIVTAEMLATPRLDPLALSPAMKKILHDYIPAKSQSQKKLAKLFDLFRYNPDFAILYDLDATYTATEVFHYQRANCLSFSAMFIALAREIGLDAQFQEVELPPEWESLDNHTLIQYRHINVTVKLQRDENRIVDFRMDLYSELFPQKAISDSHGLAQYYSNISMRHLENKHYGPAYVAALRAILANSEQSFIWNNMGIIQRRMGNLELAEIAYRQALTLDFHDTSAANNLAILYQTMGQIQLSKQMRRHSEVHKLNNAYYRYALAQHAYRNGDYDKALSQIKVAMRKQHREHRFYFLYGLSLWHIGKPQSAISNVKRAIRMADEDGSVSVYEKQLEEWLASQG